MNDWTAGTDTSKPKLLAVLAHPDDETFGMGGTLALYARRGCEVYLVCATAGRGRHGRRRIHGRASVRSPTCEGPNSAAPRSSLVSRKSSSWDYRDSGMPGSPDNRNPEALVAHSLDEVAGRIVKYIRTLRPDVVLTFDPIGGYRHPDHIHIHQATTTGLRTVGRPDVSSGERRAVQAQSALLFDLPAPVPAPSHPTDAPGRGSTPVALGAIKTLT